MAHLFYLAMKNFGFLNCFWELQIASLELFMQQNIFHWFWELIIVAWEHFMQQKLFPLLLGTTNCFLGTFYATKVISIVLGNYKLLLGNFLCNKSYFHRFWELQIASWALFMQQKLPWCVAHFIL